MSALAEQSAVAGGTSNPSQVRAALRLGRTRLGLALCLAVIGVALVGPWLVPHSPTDFVAGPFQVRAPGAPLGSDNLGRDVLSRFLAGGKALLILSVLATIAGVGLGTAVGAIAGYFRSTIDNWLMRLTDVVLAFPHIVLALLLVATFGPQPWLIVLAVAIGHAPRTARIVRAATLGVVEHDYIRAAEAVGVPWPSIVFHEIVPAISSPLLAETALRFAYSLTFVSSLSFLGLGLQPPTPDWGVMINENRLALTVAPFGTLLPAAALAILTVGTSLVSDGFSRVVAGVDRGIKS